MVGLKEPLHECRHLYSPTFYRSKLQRMAPTKPAAPRPAPAGKHTSLLPQKEAPVPSSKPSLLPRKGALPAAGKPSLLPQKAIARRLQAPLTTQQSRKLPGYVPVGTKSGLSRISKASSTTTTTRNPTKGAFKSKLVKPAAQGSQTRRKVATGTVAGKPEVKTLLAKKPTKLPQKVSADSAIPEPRVQRPPAVAADSSVTTLSAPPSPHGKEGGKQGAEEVRETTPPTTTAAAATARLGTMTITKEVSVLCITNPAPALPSVPGGEISAAQLFPPTTPNDNPLPSDATSEGPPLFTPPGEAAPLFTPPEETEGPLLFTPEGPPLFTPPGETGRSEEETNRGKTLTIERAPPLEKGSEVVGMVGGGEGVGGTVAKKQCSPVHAVTPTTLFMSTPVTAQDK